METWMQPKSSHGDAGPPTFTPFTESQDQHYLYLGPNPIAHYQLAGALDHI
jgi:hypothetical protein